MTCGHVQERLTDHVLDENPAAERAALSAHLAHCAVCAGEAERLRRTVHLLRTHVPAGAARWSALGIAAALVVSMGVWAHVSRRGPAPTKTTAAPVMTSAARFTSIDGNVKVRAFGTFEWVAADKDLILKRGDLVKTGASATAEIVFVDGTVVQLRPESLVTLEDVTERVATRERGVAWFISSGETTFRAPRRRDGARTDISTPVARLTTKDESEGAIGVKESGESRTRLFRGRAELQMTKTGETATLGPREAMTIDADGRASERSALPSVPDPVSPADQADLAYAEPTRTITPFLWTEVAEARRYRLMLDFSPLFSRPLHDTRVEASSVQLTGLDVGRYYWRVAAIDERGNEGAFSEPAQFRITRLQTSRGGAPPALVVSSLEVRGNIVQVKGRTDPGATVSVNGQPIEVESDGAFNEFITLEKPGPQHITILAVGIDGGVSKKLERIMATF